MSNLQANNTPRAISQDSFKSLIGVPYSEKDCWGIVVEFYKLVFDISLDSYYNRIPESRDIARSLVYANVKDFDEVQDRKFGDIILIKLFGVESHIAVYLGDGLMLHTSEHSGCIVERIQRWEKLIVGFYRVRNKNDKAS